MTTCAAGGLSDPGICGRVAPALCPRCRGREHEGRTTCGATTDEDSLPRHPRTTIAKAQELRREGATLREIAAALGVPASTVGGWCWGLCPERAQTEIYREANTANARRRGGK